MKEQVVAVDDGELKTSDPSTTRYIKMLFSREYFKKGRTEPAVTEIRKLAFFKKQGPALGRNEDVAVNNLVEEVDEDVEAMLTEEERVPIERRRTFFLWLRERWDGTDGLDVQLSHAAFTLSQTSRSP